MYLKQNKETQATPIWLIMDPQMEHLLFIFFLFTKDGTIGKIAIVDDLPGDTTLNSGVMVVRPLNNHFIPKYLNWVLNSSVFTEFINYIKSGTTINHLYQEEFGKFVLNLFEIHGPCDVSITSIPLGATPPSQISPLFWGI